MESTSSVAKFPICSNPAPQTISPAFVSQTALVSAGLGLADTFIIHWICGWPQLPLPPESSSLESGDMCTISHYYNNILAATAQLCISIPYCEALGNDPSLTCRA